MTRKEIKSQLLNEGWRQGSSRNLVTDVFYKIFPSEYLCRANDRQGIEIEIRTLSEHFSSGDATVSLHLRGELEDGSWFYLQNFGISTDLNKCLSKIPRLIAIWEATNEFCS